MHPPARGVRLLVWDNAPMAPSAASHFSRCTTAASFGRDPDTRRRRTQGLFVRPLLPSASSLHRLAHEDPDRPDSRLAALAAAIDALRTHAAADQRWRLRLGI